MACRRSALRDDASASSSPSSTNQDIYGGGPPRLPAPPFSLTWNCRNTRRIASYAADLIGIPCEVYPNAPKGERVASLRYRTPDEMVGQVRKQLHRLVAEEKVGTEQITVLSTHKTSRSHLAPSGAWQFQPDGAAAGPSMSGSPACTPQGLESDVVILVDVDGNRSLARSSPVRGFHTSTGTAHRA